MKTRSGAGTALVTAASVALLHLLALPAQAQEGPRWQAWVGCWVPTSNASTPVDAPADPGMVCILPANEADAVEVVAVEGSTIGNRSTLVADGQQHSVAREGCSGWESAEWSSDGSRVYTHGRHTCSEGLERTSSGLMALASNGDWIDVQSVAAGGNSGVQVVRYRPLSEPGRMPSELASTIGNRDLATSTARMAATSAVSVDDVIEASQRVDDLTVEAWLIEHDQPLRIDADALLRLADADVSTRVIDLLVAIAYPDKFAIDETARQSYGSVGRAPVPFWDPWGYYGGGYYGGGYYPYGMRRGGWYSGYPAVIVVRNPDGGSGSGSGRAVKGRGYTQGSGNTGNSGGSTAQPAPRPSSGGSSTQAGSASGSGSRDSSGSGSSGTTRTARPRSD